MQGSCTDKQWVLHAARRHMEGDDEWRPGPEQLRPDVSWDGVRTELAYTFLT